MILIIISLYLFLATIITCFMGSYSLLKGSTLARILSLMSLLVSFYLLGYLLEINSTALEMMSFWNRIQYFSLPYFPALWLLFSLLYTKKIKEITPKIFFLILFIPFLTFIIRLTNPYHGLFYHSMELMYVSSFPVLYLGKGPWYLFYSLYLFLTFLFIVSSFILHYYRESPYKRKGTFLMVISSIFPFLGLFLILIDLGRLGIDYAALFMPISLFLLLYAMVKYDLLQLKTLALERVFEHSTDAIILMDGENRLVDYNKKAGQLFKDLLPGKDLLEGVLLEDDKLLALFTDKPSDLKVSSEKGDQYYEVKTTTIKDDFQQRVGSLIQLIDVTDGRKGEEALRLSEEKYRLLAEKMSDLIWVFDLQTSKFRYVSPSVEGFFHYSVGEMMEKGLKDILTPKSYQYLLEVNPSRIKKFHQGIDEYYTDEIELMGKDNKKIITEVKGRFLHNKMTGHLEYMGVSRDITHKKMAQEALRRMATTDEMTGLYNRRHFLEQALKEFERCQRYGGSFSLFMIDIDHFKNINDTYGHLGGDEVLRDLGYQMKSYFRSTDLLGRLGGEEFAVLLLNTGLKEGYEKAEVFRKRISTLKVFYGGEEISYSISIGVTVFHGELTNLDAMIKLADDGLYESKEGGRNRTTKKIPRIKK